MTARAVEQFKIRSSAVPQLQALYQIGIEQLVGEGDYMRGIQYIGRTYLGYLRCLQCVALLHDEDVQKIIELEERIEEDDTARAKSHGKPVNKGSSAGFSHAQVLQLLGEDKRKELLELAIEGADVDSQIFSGALSECVLRLVNGSNLVAAGEEAGDHNPKFLTAYIGHTKKEITPKAMIHFLISHYLTRTFQAKYGRDPVLGTLAFDKDSLHGIISVGMRILIAQGKCPKEIQEIWTKTRIEGGLQWHNDKYDPNNKEDPKQHFYNEVFGRNPSKHE